MEQLHFHRNNHQPQAENSGSTSTPNTVSMHQKMVFHKPRADTAAQKPIPTADLKDINDLSNALRRVAISPSREHKSYQTPSLDSTDLEFSHLPKAFIGTGIDKGYEIDFNKGTNREFFSIEQRLSERHGSTDEKMKIQQAFKGFSLWSQLKPFELNPEQLKGLFHKIFVGEASKRRARVPGSWWAARKRLLFKGDKDETFLDTALSETADLHDNLLMWEPVENVQKKNLKRKRPLELSQPRRRLREYHPPGRMSEQVMSEQWRMRRRYQEKKAGRWTDGTLRMDRMWEDFYWVLDNDETWDSIS